jgi:hypothetical protein
MRCLLRLFVAAGLSLLIGLAVSEVASFMPCRGEGLVCNLDQAIGAYAVIIWSLLCPLIFGVIMLVASNRITLGAGTVLLLAPLVLFVLGSLIEGWTALGFEPYRNLRCVLTMFFPPALVVIAQWRILSATVGRAVPRTKEHPTEPTKPTLQQQTETFPPFPTE